MWSDILEQAGRLRAEEQPFVLATVVANKSPQSARPGSKAIIRADGTTTGWVGGGCVQPIVLREAKKALHTGEPKLLCIGLESAHDNGNGVESYRMTCEGGGSLEIYLEPIIPKPELLIVGRSPVAQIIAEFGRLLDFKVSLADPEASKEQFPNVDLVITDLSCLRRRVNDTSFVVVATMGNGDEEGLQAVVGTDPSYLGLVASAKKARSLFRRLRENGATDEQISRIKSPAGLHLGSETMAEIALSVMAEITHVRRAVGVKAEIVKRSVPLTVMPGADHPKALEGSRIDATDPICGMTVENARYTFVHEDETLYFCCLRCKETFEQST